MLAPKSPAQVVKPFYRDELDHPYSDLVLPQELSGLGYNFQQLLKAVQSNGARFQQIGESEVVLASLGKRKQLLFNTYSHETDYSSQWLVDDKYAFKRLLRSRNIRVPMDVLIDTKVHDQSFILGMCRKIGYPVVLKPSVEGMGNGVFSELESEADVIQALESLKTETSYTQLVLEKHYYGDEHRLFITRQGFFSAVKRTPAAVIGDGVKTLKELIEEENERRLSPRTTCLCSIKLEEVAFFYLKKHGWSLKSVPKKNERVQLRASTNVSMGGFCEDITDTVHQTVKNVALSIIEALPAVGVVGIDLICRDSTKSLTDQEYAVIELNTNPGLSLHTVPARGKSQNTPKALFESMMKGIGR